ncbi:MAG: 30S ribosomal protein S17e [Candidatus Thermoplasmatota archaeon]|nr:30S ribosomal protein S17e [Candidatus Thermoplasmatota archaeon]
MRPTYIKRMAIKLVEQMPDNFSEDFNANKNAVAEYTNINSKIMRNRIAGYISRMLENKESKNEVKGEN